jgi:hypothetical protein
MINVLESTAQDTVSPLSETQSMKKSLQQSELSLEYL